LSLVTHERPGRRIAPQVSITDVIEKIARLAGLALDELKPWNWRPADQLIAKAA
jgi:hypothetical protein